VAAADSWHQPIELPDGTILWNPNSRDSSRHQQHSSVQEVDYPEAQTDNEVLPSSGSTAGNNREIGAVGSSGLPSYISSCNEVEQQQEGETENGGDGREVEGRECKIDMLNNDCLMHIFSFLNKRERIGIERGMLFHVTHPICVLLRSFLYPFAQFISNTCAWFYESGLIDFGCPNFKGTVGDRAVIVFLYSARWGGADLKLCWLFP
jgi:hypothetical protein